MIKTSLKGSRWVLLSSGTIEIKSIEALLQVYHKEPSSSNIYFEAYLAKYTELDFYIYKHEKSDFHNSVNWHTQEGLLLSKKKLFHIVTSSSLLIKLKCSKRMFWTRFWPFF